MQLYKLANQAQITYYWHSVPLALYVHICIYSVWCNRRPRVVFCRGLPKILNVRLFTLYWLCFCSHVKIHIMIVGLTFQFLCFTVLYCKILETILNEEGYFVIILCIVLRTSDSVVWWICTYISFGLKIVYVSNRKVAYVHAYTICKYT